MIGRYQLLSIEPPKSKVIRLWIFFDTTCTSYLKNSLLLREAVFHAFNLKVCGAFFNKIQ